MVSADLHKDIDDIKPPYVKLWLKGCTIHINNTVFSYYSPEGRDAIIDSLGGYTFIRQCAAQQCIKEPDTCKIKIDDSSKIGTEEEVIGILKGSRLYHVDPFKIKIMETQGVVITFHISDNYSYNNEESAIVKAKLPFSCFTPIFQTNE